MNSKNEWWTKQRNKWLSKWRRDDRAVFGILDSRFRCQRGRTGGSKSSLSDWTLHTSIRNRGRLVKIRGSIFSKEWFKSEEGIVWLVSCATSVEDFSPPCWCRLPQEFDLLLGELAGTASLSSSSLFSSFTNYINNNRDVGCPGKERWVVADEDRLDRLSSLPSKTIQTIPTSPSTTTTKITTTKTTMVLWWHQRCNDQKQQNNNKKHSIPFEQYSSSQFSFRASNSKMPAELKLGMSDAQTAGQPKHCKVDKRLEMLTRAKA